VRSRATSGQRALSSPGHKEEVNVDGDPMETIVILVADSVEDPVSYPRLLMKFFLRASDLDQESPPFLLAGEIIFDEVRLIEEDILGFGSDILSFLGKRGFGLSISRGKSNFEDY
jgi:hypothetical protein